MHFELNREQTELQATVRRALRDHDPLRSAAGPARDTGGADDLGGEPDKALWDRLVSDLGLGGILVTEDNDGAGGSMLDAAIVMEELGRVVARAPFFSSAVLSTLLVQHAAQHPGESGRTASALLSSLANGIALASPALAEPQSSWEVTLPTTCAKRADAGWRITGTKSLVLDGPTADLFVVSAASGDGAALFAVNNDAPGLHLSCDRALDPTRPVGNLNLDGTPATLLLPSPFTDMAVRQVLALARLLLASEQLGGSEACLKLAVDHASARHQFGRPIGGFQAIKHMCADMFVRVETTRNAVRYAAWLSSTGEDITLPSAIAYHFASDAYLENAGALLQILGGIGYTWEHPAHLHFKRARSSATILDPRRSILEVIGRAHT